jgi:hypothetical protein
VAQWHNATTESTNAVEPDTQPIESIAQPVAPATDESVSTEETRLADRDQQQAHRDERQDAATDRAKVVKPDGLTPLEREFVGRYRVVVVNRRNGSRQVLGIESKADRTFVVSDGQTGTWKVQNGTILIDATGSAIKAIRILKKGRGAFTATAVDPNTREQVDFLLTRLEP